jgi:hypothetical protein
MPCPLHCSWLDHSYYTWRKVQIMKLLVMQFSPASYHFIPLRSKYSPQHPVLKYSQSMLLRQRPSFIPMQNCKQNYTFVCFNFYVST